MFHEIPDRVRRRMTYLEEIDTRDRQDGTPRLQRLRQIPPETGKFIALLASTCPDGVFIELGTSAGYSTMWLSLVAMERSNTIKTYELLPEKIRLAKETFREAKIEEYVKLFEGDALENLGELDAVSFCFLDIEKELYERCYDMLASRMVKNGLIVADNAINHYETLKPMIEKALSDPRFDSMVVPIGKGELVCRRK